MNFKQYFATLIDWNQLPAYRLEERIESFIGYFLSDIMEEAIGVKVKGIIPEFPLRLATIRPEFSGKPLAERSYKVDFFVLGENDIHYFIEVKTIKSGLDQQDDFLQKAKLRGMEKIIEGVTRIAKLSSHKSKDKYQHLKDKLKEYGILNRIESYIHPSDEIQIIHLQPRLPRKDKGEQIITFKTLADILRKRYPGPEDEFVAEFANALEIWGEG